MKFTDLTTRVRGRNEIQRRRPTSDRRNRCLADDASPRRLRGCGTEERRTEGQPEEEEYFPSIRVLKSPPFSSDHHESQVEEEAYEEVEEEAPKDETEI
uniref:Uncharacterized protein n=1 Tax=Chenopodium quinoa TaxID=63459 RepID=A0A803KRL1_CHEQI